MTNLECNHLLQKQWWAALGQGCKDPNGSRNNLLIHKHLCSFTFCGKQRSGRWWKFITLIPIHSSDVTAHTAAGQAQERELETQRSTVGIQPGKLGTVYQKLTEHSGGHSMPDISKCRKPLPPYSRKDKEGRWSRVSQARCPLWAGATEETVSHRGCTAGAGAKGV